MRVTQLQPRQPAATAVRVLLLGLLDGMESNVEGAASGLEIEPLHDLRVTCRRTRSALGELKGVLPPGAVGPLVDEIKWLGKVTGPLRDLDVLLEAMPAHRAGLPPEAATGLDSLGRLLERLRADAHRTVALTLRSARFYRLMTSWRAALETAGPTPAPDADRPVKELADDSIDRAYRRILKRGTKLGADPPPRALHRLRIDAKKLRYLLELFAGLYPDAEIADRLRELKRLQNILGAFNDLDNQQTRLTACAAELRADPVTDEDCIEAIGRLTAILARRQDDLRLTFHEGFSELSSAPVREAYRLLFGDRERS